MESKKHWSYRIEGKIMVTRLESIWGSARKRSGSMGRMLLFDRRVFYSTVKQI
jgi:hypothetical protein